MCEVKDQARCSQLYLSCEDHLPSFFLLEGKEVDYDEDEVVWTVWENINRKVALKAVTDTSAGLLNEINER